MPSREAIIARYKEDVSWISLLSDCRVVIYDKSPDPLPGTVWCSNIGREGETYLTYIVDRYDSLPDYCIFLQGWPWDHIAMNSENIITMNESLADYAPLGWVAHFNAFENSSAMEMARLVEIISRRRWRNDRDIARFTVGANFLVSRKMIRAHDPSIYDGLLRIMRDPTQTELAGYGVERLWGWLFGREIEFFNEL